MLPLPFRRKFIFNKEFSMKKEINTAKEVSNGPLSGQALRLAGRVSPYEMFRPPYQGSYYRLCSYFAGLLLAKGGKMGGA